MGCCFKICLLGLSAITMFAATGCRPIPEVTAPKIALYTGPLASQQDVIRQLAARNAQVRTVWARHDFQIVARNSKGKTDSLNGSGVLVLRKPATGEDGPTEVSLKGRQDVLGEVFAVGANRERAWLILRGDIDTMYWLPQGSTAKIDPAMLPARPDVIADILGLGDVATDLTTPPVPVMRYDGDSDAYVLTYVEPADDAPERFIARREVVVSRADLRTQEVRLFGSDGRLTARSKLATWVSLPGTRGEVPTDITLEFPLSQSTMRFVLQDPKVSQDGVPRDATFRFPAEPGVSRQVRLDEPGAVKE